MLFHLSSNNSLSNPLMVPRHSNNHNNSHSNCWRRNRNRLLKSARRRHATSARLLGPIR